MAVLIPDLLYRDGAFRSGIGVEYDEATGRMTRVAAATEAGTPESIRLRGVALMPGFVNAHSHAFQRLIRGRTQWRPADGRVPDFWSWRQAMYHAALRLSPDDVYHASRFCFVEMLRAGITTVGEFHYLHNDTAGRPYADPAELARRVLAAAVDAGIRICLLNVCYMTAGIGRPLRPEQRRFGTPDVAAFLDTTQLLADEAGSAELVSVGVAPHSVRAVSRETVRALHDWSRSRGLPCHMHVSEQPAEVEACVAAYGRRPVELLNDDGVLGDGFTAIHATHISDAEVRMLAESGATVCACPGTERDLGDGFLRAADLVRAGGRIALGTDSQTVIDLLEEMRLVEYNERLQRLERVVITRSGDAARRVHAPLLLEMATSAGARSLHLPTGALEAGALADMIGIDLGHPALAGWTPATLPAMIALCAPADVVRDVWVGGRQVVTQREHPRLEDAMHAFNDVARSLADPA
jgi:formimidoylglutamate deiminase